MNVASIKLSMSGVISESIVKPFTTLVETCPAQSKAVFIWMARIALKVLGKKGKVVWPFNGPLCCLCCKPRDNNEDNNNTVKESPNGRERKRFSIKTLSTLLLK